MMTVDGADAAYIEASEEGRHVVDAADARLFRVRCDRIRDRALPIDASIEPIEQMLEAF
jgi:hypothetical protein